MRLISCYIENFGGLQNFSLTFNEGITVINEPNGFGKTTLATFIRTMFYGFPRTSKTMGKNDRKKFIPWQSGTFGGNLVFELGGEKYRVERTFGTAPKNDTFSLYKLDPIRKCDDFSDQLGVEIFGLDADSFERSTYMPQIREDSSFDTANIQAKLGNLIEDTNDINNYDDAVDALKKERSKLIAFRGNGGTVAEAQRKMAEFELRARNLKEQKISLQNITAEAEKLEKEIENETLRAHKLREEISQAYGAAMRVQLEKQRTKLLQEEKTIDEQLAAYNEKYSGGVPETERIKPIFEYVGELERLSSADWNTQAYIEATEILEKNKTRFSKGVPDDEQFKACREKLGELTANKAQLVKLEENVQGETVFETLPTQEEITENKEKLSRIDKFRRENSHAFADTATSQGKTKGKKTALVCAIIGVALVAASVAFFVLSQYAIGAALVVIGAVTLIGAVYFSIKDMVTSNMGGTDSVAKEKIRRNEEQIQKLEQEVRNFGLKYGAGEENLFDAVNSVQLKVQHALELKNNAETAAKIRAQIAETEKQVIEFLQMYEKQGNSDTFSEKLTELMLECSDYQQAKRLLEEAENRKISNEKRKSQLFELVDAFFAGVGAENLPHTSNALREMQEDALRYNDLCVRKQNTRLELEQFLEQNSEKLKIPLDCETVDTEALKEQESELANNLNEKNRMLSELRSQIRNIRNEVDILPELEDEIIRLEQQKKDDTYKAAILDKTVEFLSKAKESLSSSYLGGVKERFIYYMSQLSEETGETVFVNQKLEVALERHGMAREIGYFSAGYSDIIMLCMRFALVDALFPETKPFIILDDPFINLDDSNTKKALSLLKRLGEERQIVYLVCNSSRNV